MSAPYLLFLNEAYRFAWYCQEIWMFWLFILVNILCYSIYLPKAIMNFVHTFKFVSDGPINNIPSSVQIMAWCRPVDKSSSETMMGSLPTHICATRLHWAKTGLLSPRELISTIFIRLVSKTPVQIVSKQIAMLHPGWLLLWKYYPSLYCANFIRVLTKMKFVYNNSLHINCSIAWHRQTFNKTFKRKLAVR